MFVPPNRTAHGNPSLHVRSIVYLGHFQAMADQATEPFVLHAWLLRRNQLKFGNIIDNHITGKKLRARHQYVAIYERLKKLSKNFFDIDCIQPFFFVLQIQ
jgi:hypothetical protein